MRARHRRLAAFALSAGGYILTAVILVWGFYSGKFTIPGNDALIWDRVGDQVRAGLSPYSWPDPTTAFYYAPPWALAFAVVSWLPVEAVALAMIVLEVAALRFVAGSWLRVGYCLWFPLVAFELPSSQTNLLMAAAIAAAIRGDPRGAVVMASAKLSPILAIDPRAWRRVLPVAAALVLVTIPWVGLWADWILELVSAFGTNTAPAATVQIPLAPRLVVAAVLVLVIHRPWARGLAAIVATPAIYFVTSIMFLALVPSRQPRASGTVSS